MLLERDPNKEGSEEVKAMIQKIRDFKEH